MKNKTFTIISAIVLLALFSCSKQENMSNEKAQKMNDGKVYTIVAQFDAQENGSKTTIDPENKNATAWVEGDKIWLHNGNTDGMGEVTQIQADGKAVITTSLDISTGTLYAVYPSPEGYDYQTPADCPYSIVDGEIQIVIPTAQDGVFAKAHICAAIMKDKKLTFKNAITLMKVTGIKAGSGINQFVFPGAGGTITFNPALAKKDENTGISVSERTDVTVTPGATGPYYVAVAPTTEYPMNGIIANYNKDTKGEYSKRANKLTPLLRSRVYNLGEAPGTSLPYDALPGIFTVNAKTKKTVVFSRGNLFCDNTSGSAQWGFHEHQYDCCFKNGHAWAITDDDKIFDLFSWGYDKNQTYTATTTYTAAAFNDWGICVDPANPAKWRTLTRKDYCCLIGQELWGISDKDELRNSDNWLYTGITVSDSDITVSGIIILPDGWTDKWNNDVKDKSGNKILSGFKNSPQPNTVDLDKFKILENLGAVFFPYGGKRSGGGLQGLNGMALYWCSDNDGTTNAYICMMQNVSGYPSASSSDNKVNGNLVRLVYDLN